MGIATNKVGTKGIISMVDTCLWAVVFLLKVIELMSNVSHDRRAH